MFIIFSGTECGKVKVSSKTLVLEVWIATFGESLVENARLFDLTLVYLEVWILTFFESLVENTRFGRVSLVQKSLMENARLFGSANSHGKRSF